MSECEYCAAPIDVEVEPHTVSLDYPAPGVTMLWCRQCVDVDAEPAKRGEKVRSLFIARLMIACSDNPAAPRIAPGNA